LDRAGEINRLKLIAAKIRKNALESITKTKAGHPGGSLSVADILTALYFGRTYDPESGLWENILRYDSADPLWPNRDRLILSKGHAAPALYSSLAQAGFFSEDLLKIYRKIDSPLEGHPAMYTVHEEDGRVVERGTKGVDFSTGSLGHGLSAGAGMALHAQVYGYDYHVYVILGDGDMQEGMTWEACLTIPNKRLNKLCGIIDCNRLQVDGRTDDINRLDPLAQKLEAFNWEVKEIDGHDFYALVDALDEFKKTRTESARPLMIIANTVKGKGASEIEDVCKYHGVPLNDEEYGRAETECLALIDNLEKSVSTRPQGEIKVKPLVKMPAHAKNQDLEEIIHRNPPQGYREPTATRIGYGNALARLGEYEKVFVLNADLMGACGATAFCEKYPENAEELFRRRSINVGVQEANMMTMGAAMAACGKIPVVNSFGVFSTGRAWEMVRQDIAYPRLNVKIIGSHTGIALGEYGVSHQAIADVGAMRILPGIVIVEPSDAVQADLLFEKVLQYDGPVYFRVGRNPTPLVYAEDNAFGVSPIREFQIGKGYRIKEGKDITLICSGPILIEALKVASLIKESVAVIDMPTIRPVDGELVEEAARQTGRICTIQDHYENGGLRDEVMKAITAGRIAVQFDYVALSGFAKSGSPADLYDHFGLSARRIIEKLRLTPVSVFHRPL
ncbi:MAG: transketolase, partial [Deltaproteobacteria bacterium]|nr:transketolase [Deltaproteobacteria bacterium]